MDYGDTLFIQSVYDIKDSFLPGRVKIGCRFVKDDMFRRHGQNTCYCHKLLFSVGKAVRWPLGILFNANKFK